MFNKHTILVGSNILVALAAILAAPEVLGLLPPEAVRFVPAVQAVITITIRFWPKFSREEVNNA